MTCILLTGSSRGIGAATHDLLKDRGVQIIGHRSVNAQGDEIAVDFARAGAAAALWEAAIAKSKTGTIDVLINNAGLFEASDLDRDSDDWHAAWEKTLRINLTAAAELSRLAILHWLQRGIPGRIVHVASRAGHRGDSPAHWHYAAAKGGLLALHKTIARAYAGNDILSFAIAPGFVDTAMAGDYLASRGGPELLADIPLGRVAEPQEIGRIAVFCALDAPASMTGATLDANGASYVR